MELVDYLELSKLQDSLSKRLPAIIITSLTLTAGLAWNDVIQLIINYYVPENKKQEMNVWAKLMYVIILSIIIIIIIGVLLRFESDNATNSVSDSATNNIGAIYVKK
jgi:hypothetical protein